MEFLFVASKTVPLVGVGGSKARPYLMAKN